MDGSGGFRLYYMLTSLGLLWCRFWLLHCMFTFHTDSFEQYTGRFIGWVLRYKSPLESPFENCLAQSISAFEVRSDNDFECVDNRETTFNLCDDTVLFWQRRQSDD